jgi:formylglycine-generating enzyme required for sulfatase activity
MRCIEGGSFVDVPVYEGPASQHDIATFLLDTFEVTRGDYSLCVADGSCAAPTQGSPGCTWWLEGADDYAMNCVAWRDAANYCAWAGKRLPTEWQWEWAARGRDEARVYPWGDAEPSCDLAVMGDGSGIPDGCGAYSPVSVGTRPAGQSRDGVYDLAGNVFEWTDSWYDAAEVTRTVRGGSYLFTGARSYEVALRVEGGMGTLGGDPLDGNDTIGFRCARKP